MRDLSSYVYKRFKDAVVAKAPYTEKWMTYLSAWNGDLFENKHLPSYRTNHVSNFIYSSIESMRPILFDNNPRFEAIPVTTEAMDYSNDVTTVLDYEWERTNMQEKLLANSVYTFAIGTSVIFLPYTYSDKKENGIDGDVDPTPVSPFNIYPDPLATSVEDAEYIIYAEYVHEGKLRKKYPEYKDEIIGQAITYSELVNDRDRNSNIHDQVLLLEMWCRDYTEVDNEDGEKQKKYPRGRVIVCAPDLGIVFEDKQNPYKTGRFPFFLFKDIDVPFQFWGEGEVKWLLSPQNQANDLYNQIIDNAKSTANMQWIIDKNAGIAKGELTNRPGLIIRKNPGTEVKRESPPSMPMYVQQMIDTLKADIEVISGIHDVTRGQTPSGVQSAAAIVALQEAAQTRIRLKEQLHENALGVLGTEWVERIRQFWKFNRLVPKKIDASSKLETAQLMGMEMMLPVDDQEMNHYELIDVDPDIQLKHTYRIVVLGTSALQHSKASMLDQLTRLAQTPAEDGLPLIPREAILDYLPGINKRMVLQYFQKLKQEAMQQQNQQGLNNDAMQQLQMIGQQLQQIAQQVQGLQQRADQQDQQMRDDQLKIQGYQQGLSDQAGMNAGMQMQGQIPSALYDEMSMMDNESLSVMLQSHPELLMDMGQ